MARNRMNFWTAAESRRAFLKKLGFKLTQGQHDIQVLFLNPRDEYPYNHPKFKGDETKPKDSKPSEKPKATAKDKKKSA